MSMPMRLRPRQDFPTPLFKVIVSLFLVAVVALVIYLAAA
jgi:hypothetical protein